MGGKATTDALELSGARYYIGSVTHTHLGKSLVVWIPSTPIIPQKPRAEDGLVRVRG